MGECRMKGIKHEFENLSNEIISTAIEVQSILKSGFIESIYHNAMIKELTLRGIQFETEKTIEIFYKGEKVGEHRIDLIVNEEIIVELKCVKEISDAHISQVLSYLNATGIHTGLILNFSKSKIDIKRVVK